MLCDISILRRGCRVYYLDFYKDNDGRNKSATVKLEMSGLDLYKEFAYNADKATVSYGKQNKVYQNLKLTRGGLVI